MAAGEDDFSDAMLREIFYNMRHEGTVQYRQHRFGGVDCQRPQPGAEAAYENQGFHKKIPALAFNVGWAGLIKPAGVMIILTELVPLNQVQAKTWS